MPSFIYDGTSIATKTDLTAIPGGADPANYFRATDWAAMRTALLDTRSAVLAGRLHGFTGEAERPVVSGASRFLWVDSDDDKLYYYDGSTDIDLTSGGGGGHTIRNDAGNLAARTGLHFLTADFVVADDAGGDETDISLASTVARTTRDLIAGAGLTGGGTLAADRTFNVVANADGSIVVNANDVQVGVLASDAQHGARGGGTQHAVAIAAGAAGFMSGADKTKLDDLPTAAALTTTLGGYVPTARTLTMGSTDLTIDSVPSADLSANRTILLASALAPKTFQSAVAATPAVALNKGDGAADNWLLDYQADGASVGHWELDASNNTRFVLPTTQTLTFELDSVFKLDNPTAAASPSTYNVSPLLRFESNHRLSEGAATSGSMDLYSQAISTGRQELRIAKDAVDIAAFQSGGGGLFLYYQDSIDQVATLLTLRYTTSGTAGPGIGSALLFQAEDAGGSVQDAGSISGVLSVATAGSEKGYLSLQAANGSGTLAAGAYVWGTGRVGIGTGTTEPTEKLEITGGNARINGMIGANAAPGTGTAAFNLLTPAGWNTAVPGMVLDVKSGSSSSVFLLDLKRSATYVGQLYADAADYLVIGSPNGVTLATSGTAKFSVNGTGIGFYGTTPVGRSGTPFTLNSGALAHDLPATPTAQQVGDALRQLLTYLGDVSGSGLINVTA